MKVSLAAVAAGLLAALTAPSAMAATLGSDGECYREGQEANFLGSGFQPNQPVAISLDGQQQGTKIADPLGRVGVPVSIGSIPRSEQASVLSMSQVSNPAVSATKSFRVTKVYVVTKPSRFRPGRRLRIRAGGFFRTGGRTLYGHVRGPNKRNLRIGRVKGPCGKVSATKKVILKRGDRPGVYIVQFDTSRKYIGTRAPLWYRRGYRIDRIFRFSRTSSFAAPVFSRSS
jgi:hypothetical protein